MSSLLHNNIMITRVILSQISKCSGTAWPSHILMKSSQTVQLVQRSSTFLGTRHTYMYPFKNFLVTKQAFLLLGFLWIVLKSGCIRIRLIATLSKSAINSKKFW